MQKDFELETILSVTTGINCTNNFSKVHELLSFVFNDNFMNNMALEFCKDDLKEHLLNIHPQLINVIPPTIHYGIFLDSWLKKQKETFGDFLTVSEFDKPLVQNINTCNNTKKLKYEKPIIKIQELEEKTVGDFENNYFIEKGPVLKKIRKNKKNKRTIQF